MSIEIEKSILENACREMIETILFCLPNAYKGTIYRIGKPPYLTAERITSGILDDKREKISWGLPAKSEYNPPGKPWTAYRDEPGRPLEAMSWCVENQKSWTVEDPRNDIRSVRFQVEGMLEDFHHLEPVLVRKADLALENGSLSSEYPRDYNDNVIWKDSEYLVVGVIKIHFHPFTIKINSHETRVIKKLSRSFGTELLSYQLRQDSIRTREQLAKSRLNACNILADPLRNAITKSGLIFSLVKNEIGHLRIEWEQLLRKDLREKDAKLEAIRDLNKMAIRLGDEYQDLRQDLIDTQNKFLQLSLPPEKGEHWVANRIEERWKTFFSQCHVDAHTRNKIVQAIDKLKKSLHFGQHPESIAHCDKIPGELKREWIDLIYGKYDSFDPSVLESLIKILGNPALTIPSGHRSKKTLTQLKALGETMSELEKNTNFLLRQVLKGADDGQVSEILGTITVGSESRSDLFGGSFNSGEVNAMS